MINTYYIQAKSKKAVKDSLSNGEKVLCLSFGFMSQTQTYIFQDIPNGSVIKIFDKFVSGSPYAKAYGNKKNGKLV